ncbi:alpha/beta hydrolase domain-containing protein [Asticcacaulis sp. 201]|uniref:alpha/beta hydrolase domain-containing protein n=1 Tax=Asticcacaulis sp. 201 TaxID=3028787 RepID=UPI002916FE29|nr:alpha/beta hydrolase domain-containing protein [Asticcacaulis sp. 201]MDV6329987.1 alpha/beta hydrolase domain-containing protein [Asticcacaulis sp. 201]
MRAITCLLLSVAALVGSVQIASAEVTRVDITEQRPWLEGKVLGNTGTYELLRGRVHYQVDPNGPDGRRIADVALAPRNASGMVEFSGPFLLLRPADPSKSNGATVIEVANRGVTQMNYTFFESDGFDLLKKTDLAFRTTQIFDHGYTLAWVGWQADLPADQFGLSVPTGTGQGAVRLVLLPEDLKDGELSLNGNNNYCAADVVQKGATLRPLKSLNTHGRALPRSSFAFAHSKGGKLTPDACTLHVKTPLAKNTLYELVYQGAPAPVIGLGLAAVRDFGDHLKGRGVASALNARPQAASALIAFGYSQSARFLRDYLYRGFNADKTGLRVFDGMLISGAGAGRGSFDHRYAMPGEAGNSVLSILRPVDLYPFAETAAPDIDGTGNASALDATRAQGTMPKIMHTMSSTEYWARIGSLLTVSPDGKRELPLDPSSRLYYFPSSVHNPSPVRDPEEVKAMAPFGSNLNYDNFNALNALLDDLMMWIRDGVEPPPSVYPHLGSTLVPATELMFPALKGVKVPAAPPPVWQLDFGPAYASHGIIANEPPKTGRQYLLLVPQVDADGNELGGYKGIFAAVPLGTYTAWYTPPEAYQPFGLLAELHGGFLPFAKTKAEREATGDPRLSIAERYGDKAGYQAKVKAALDMAIADRMLATYDRDDLYDFAMKAWEKYAELPPPEK